MDTESLQHKSNQHLRKAKIQPYYNHVIVLTIKSQAKICSSGISHQLSVICEWNKVSVFSFKQHKNVNDVCAGRPVEMTTPHHRIFPYSGARVIVIKNGSVFRVLNGHFYCCFPLSRYPVSLKPSLFETSSLFRQHQSTPQAHCVEALQTVEFKSQNSLRPLKSVIKWQSQGALKLCQSVYMGPFV